MEGKSKAISGLKKLNSLTGEAIPLRRRGMEVSAYHIYRF